MTESFFFGESQLIHAAGLENDNPEEQPSLAEPPIISIDVSHLYHTDQVLIAQIFACFVCFVYALFYALCLVYPETAFPFER